MADVQPGPHSIYPILRFVCEFFFTRPEGEGQENVVFLLLSRALVSVLDRKGNRTYLGKAENEMARNKIRHGIAEKINFDLQLDHYGLYRIENLRNGGALELEIRFLLDTRYRESVTEDECTMRHTIEKSKWVEDILSDLEFKKVHLLEIPVLSNGDFSQAVGYLDEAWRHFSMGEHDDTLSNCRKALEELRKVAEKKDLAKEVPVNEGKTIRIPDFEKILGSSRAGENLQGVFRQLHSFLSAGAHAGKAINREDADFALMCTHGLINLVVRKLGANQ